MPYPDDPIGHRIEVAPGADLTAAPSTYTWTEVTTDVTYSETITAKRGSEDEQGSTTSSGSLVFDNGPMKGAGRYFVDQPESDLYPYFEDGLPIRHSVNIGDGSGWQQRWVQYVGRINDDWPSGTPYRVLTRVDTGGLFRRLGQGKALKHPLRRSVDASGDAVVGYWPLNDADGSTLAKSGFEGGDPMSPTLGVEFGSVQGGPQGPYLEVAKSVEMDLSGGYYYYPHLSAPLSVGSDAKSVQIECWFRLELNPQTWLTSDFGLGGSSPVAQNVDLFVVEMNSDSSWVVFQVGINYYPPTDTPTIYASFTLAPFSSDGGATLELLPRAGTAPLDTITGGWHYLRISLNQDDATNVTGTMQVDGNAAYLDTFTLARTLGLPRNITVAAGSLLTVGSLSNSAPFGSVSVGELVVGTEVVDRYDAATGYIGELAHERIARLCTEEGVPYSITASDSAAMGPQQAGTFLGELRSCESTDRGILDDSQGVVGYRALSELYNQDAQLTIDANNRELFGPYQPVRDDQGRRNSITARMPAGGASATVRDEADIAKRGLYDGDLTDINPELPSALLHQAGWAVNIGTAQGMRRPNLTLDLLRAPQHCVPYLGMALGDRVTVTNLPRRSAVGDVDVMVRGWTETYGPGRRKWKSVLNCVPWLPYEVFEIGGSGNRQRLDLPDSTLKAAVVDAAATSMSITTPSMRWATTADNPAELSFDLEVGGERVTLTAMSNVAATYVAAGTAAHASNASVTPGLPAGLVAGDLLLVFAAIRNHTFGRPVKPDGFETLLQVGNIALYGKLAETGETDPSITFTGGVANATTSAQCAAFRNCSPFVHRSGSKLNASAADIGHPGVSPNYAGCVVIILGWKADDWTSVAALAGAAEIGEPSSTVGDDQGIVWDYVIQGAAADIAPGSFVVTGGGSAVSRGAIVALNAGGQTATVTRSVNGVRKLHAAGVPVRLWRASVIGL